MTSHGIRSGQVLDGQYALIRKLGAGSTGAVWLARTMSGSVVACKILHPRLRNNIRIVGQLRKEAEILSQLRHTNITRQVDICTEGTYAYLVMEYVDGEPLDEVLGDRTRLGFHLAGGVVRSIFGQICDAVEYAHSNQIIHRDVKPQNVMAIETPAGPKVKVLDFGHARLLEGSPFDATTDGRSLGSPMYMSPEQVKGRPATVRSDVFALGIVLFEMLTLHRAWVRDEQNRPLTAFDKPIPPAWNNFASILYRIVAAPRPRLRELRPGLPSSLEVLVDQTLSFDPKDRPSSVAELRAAVWPELAALPEYDERILECCGPAAERLFDEFGVEPGVEDTDFATSRGGAWLLGAELADLEFSMEGAREGANDLEKLLHVDRVSEAGDNRRDILHEPVYEPGVVGPLSRGDTGGLLVIDPRTIVQDGPATDPDEAPIEDSDDGLREPSLVGQPTGAYADVGGGPLDRPMQAAITKTDLVRVPRDAGAELHEAERMLVRVGRTSTGLSPRRAHGVEPADGGLNPCVSVKPTSLLPDYIACPPTALLPDSGMKPVARSLFARRPWMRDFAWVLFSVAIGLLGCLFGMRISSAHEISAEASVQAVDSPEPPAADSGSGRDRGTVSDVGIRGVALD